MISKPVQDTEMKADAEVIDCTMEETKVCISENDFLKELVQKFFMQATL